MADIPAGLPEGVAELVERLRVIFVGSKLSIAEKDTIVDAMDTIEHLAKSLADERTLCDRFRYALAIIADVGDGYGPRNQMSGTTGEGHAECRNVADDALGIIFEDIPRDPEDAGHESILTKFAARQRTTKETQT